MPDKDSANRNVPQMHEYPPHENDQEPFWPYIVAGAFVLLTALCWLFIYSDISFNFNVIWLSECGRRILAGGTLNGSCFESNPPLSILLYMPLVLIEQVFPDIPAHVIFSYYIFAFIAPATAAVFWLSGKVQAVSKKDAFVLSMLFLLANTSLTGRFFGERDHFSFIGLFVFFLAQYVITQRQTEANRSLLYLTLLISGIGILIKPHYGLIPFFMMIDRLRQWKSLRAVFQPDILILGGLCFIYIALITRLFPDYITTILPEEFSVYAPSKFQQALFAPFMVGMALTLACWFAMSCIASESIKPFLHHLFIVSAVGILVFLIQKKGWGYHLIPFEGTFFCCLFFSLYKTLPYLPQQKKTSLPIRLGIIFTAILISVFVNAIPKQTPDHQAFRNYNLARIIRDYPPDETCSFMMFAGMREIQSLAYYNHCELASRFSAIWFFELVFRYMNAKDDAEKQTALLHIGFYADMIADDIERYHPQVIITRKGEEPFYDALLKSSTKLRNIWKGAYTLVKTLPSETPEYFAGTRYADKNRKEGYDIYRRNDLIKAH